jgi:hypothetical protein
MDAEDEPPVNLAPDDGSADSGDGAGGGPLAWLGAPQGPDECHANTQPPANAHVRLAGMAEPPHKRHVKVQAPAAPRKTSRRVLEKV